VTVAVLFARSDSIYKSIPGCDVWDVDRDALRWPGGAPVVAHPPCRAWGSLRHFAKPRPGEMNLAWFALGAVRKWGGVLEHPKASKLWEEAKLPRGNEFDEFGGWTLAVNQCWFGHRAEKATLLYIVGVRPAKLAALPMSRKPPTHVIAQSHDRKAGRRVKSSRGWRPEVSPREREATPPEFAYWLVDLARQCRMLR